MATLGKIKVKRPPFDFPVSDDFAEHINKLADELEAEKRNWGLIPVWEEQVRADSRELREGSDEEHWILEYYYHRGWMDDCIN